MPNCSNCNTQCVESANYCHHCGIYLSNDNNQNTQDLTKEKQDEFNSALRRLMPTKYIEKLINVILYQDLSVILPDTDTLAPSQQNIINILKNLLTKIKKNNYFSKSPKLFINFTWTNL